MIHNGILYYIVINNLNPHKYIRQVQRRTVLQISRLQGKKGRIVIHYDNIGILYYIVINIVLKISRLKGEKGRIVIHYDTYWHPILHCYQQFRSPQIHKPGAVLYCPAPKKGRIMRYSMIHIGILY